MRQVGRLLLSMTLAATGLVLLAPGAGRASLEPGVGALWETSVTPGIPNWPDTNPVEVGVKFVTSEDISVVGVRFYKGNLNTGFHSGSLWDAKDRALLAQATFTSETEQGWQDVLFDAPVPMSPGDVYIASYFVPIGYYSAVNEYFATSVTSGPVTALSSSEADGNGVYVYGSTAYPEFTYRSSNYWVTPLWDTNGSPVVDAGEDTSVNEGSGIALAGSVTDPDADAVTTTWSISAGPDHGGTCTFADPTALATTITCTDNGTVVVTLTASDGVNAPVSDSVTVNVANVAATVSAAFGAASVSCGTNNAMLTVTFSDPAAADTHSAVINWGDGNTQTVSAATSPLVLSHTYAAAGNYIATVSVSDNDGATGNTSANVIVQFNTGSFLQPINPNGTSVFKYKSTIPVKIGFTNCDGSVPNNLAPTIKLTMISGAAPGFEINEPISTSAADATGVMRFSTNQYIYNLATKPLPDPSATYRITVTTPNNGQTFTVQFGLKP